MSEIINNREYRQKVLKELIMELHNGKPVEEVKARFAKLIEGISPSEISDMEQSLIMEGMPVTEVQRLCDVHAAVFKGSIEDIHKEIPSEDKPGHPVHTFKLENREIEKLINNKIKPDINAFNNDDTKDNVYKLIEDLNLLWDIDKHYSRKENILFPYMEKYGITAPPKVMWGVDDEIRDGLKDLKESLMKYDGNKEETVKRFSSEMDRIIEMVFKEENILFPMTLETLTPDEWLKIENDSDEIGYCLTEPKGKWAPDNASELASQKEADISGAVRFDTGILTVEEISSMLNSIPGDITFVDKNDTVKYFSQGKERIFPRTRAVIGRKVQNCHPPASVHIIEKMVMDFKNGIKEHEDFWIRMGDKFVFIRYFAVRNEKGDYVGTLEFTQDVKEIQELKGEKRLVSD